MNQNQNSNDNQENSNQGQAGFRKNGIKTNILRVAKVVTRLAAPILPFVIIISLLVITVFDFSVEIFTAQDTASSIIENLEIEDLTELVEIKEDGQGGYYLDFVDDIDKKLEDINEQMSKTTGVHNLPKSSEMLKKIIKAELVTQYPDLGGVIPEGSDGFQGAVKLRRATPDKEIEEMKNTGVEDSIPLVESDILDPGGVGRYEEIVKSWSAGQKLTIRARATIYEQAESEINPGSDTGYWEEVLDDTGRVRTIAKGTQVEYTGTYKNNTNLASGNTITYVEIKYEGENVYVRANYLTDNSNSTEEVDEAKIRNNFTVSSRAEANRAGKQELNGLKDEYVIAIAAGRNNTDDKGTTSGELVEEDLTIEVAEKVQELIEERYSDIKVVQTGSTSSNRGGVSPEERAQLAKDANPDLCIQIYFNSSSSEDDNGVEVIYKDGDGISLQLAEILSESISQEMGLENKSAGSDVDKKGGNLVIIDNAASTGFPSVVTQGGYITGNKDAQVIKDGGVEKYAEGIVKGVVEYLLSLHDGYTSTEVEEETLTEGISSVVRNLKYVPLETIEQYIEEGNLEALEVFSLDEDNNLITATWSSTDGELSLRKNSPINLETALQKYILPYEYILFFYIDTNDEDFCIDFADTVINETEIVIALQDNVTTTETTTTVQEKREDDNSANEYDGKDISSSTSKMETCSTAIDITYVKTWFMKSYQENSYSEEVLNLGDEESKVVTIKGKVSDIKQNSATDWAVHSSGTTGNGDNYTIYRKNITTDWKISNQYEAGELTTEGNESTFVKLYNEHKMDRKVRPDYLFIMLSENDRTANLVDLTKYLMYKATNVNYGVIEFDFSVFEIEQFKQVGAGGLNLLIEYIHYWEHSTPPPTNADGTKYIIENDGAGNAVVGYGVDIFNGGFADEFAAAGQPTNFGGEVDKEFVDALEEREIQSCLDSVRSITSGLNLKEYQIYALVSRAYNCGIGGALTTKRGSPSMNFVDSCNAYWNAETDDKFEAKDPNADFGHSLYTQYMSKPVTASGSYLAGLERRRKSEWVLFQTGYFDVLDKWYAEGGDLLAAADEIHTRMDINHEAWTYSIGGDLFWNNIEMSINNPNKVTCCATFVSSAIYKAGYFTEEQMNSFNYNSSTALHSFLASNGWQEVSSYDELQPGDVVFMTSGGSGIGHVQLYAGDGLWYNAGSTNAIQTVNPYSQGDSYPRSRFIVALRAV